MFRPIAIMAAALLVLTAAVAAQADRKYYVAPDGNDGWSGGLAAPNASHRDGPFATVVRARDAIRQLRAKPPGLTEPVTVYLRGGTYYLTEPLVLMPEDSGARGRPVTYAAYAGEKPVISGGAPITGWQPSEVNGKPAWVAHLPAVARGEWRFAQLFVNGQRRPRPRLPKEGLYQFTQLIRNGVPVPADQLSEVPITEVNLRMGFADNDIRQWRNLREVEIVALIYWLDMHLPIAAVNEKKHIVTFTKPSVFSLRHSYWKEFAYYYADNVFEALDTPGQWYLDRPTGALYYLPLPGEKPGQVQAVAPRLAQVVRFEGEPEKGRFVEHVRLSGLSFMHTEWHLPGNSAGSVQAAYQVPGAIQWRGARYCTLRDCAIAHTGDYAVEVSEGCDGNAIRRNLMFDLGAGGVKLGPVVAPIGVESKVEPGPACVGTTVADNDIGDGGHVFHAGEGVWIGDSGYNRIVHNHIHEFDYTGVSVGWSWGLGRSRAVGNRIEFNHIHDIGRGRLSDLGGIYTLGISPGTVLRNNLIHDSSSAVYGGWGIYLDEGSSGIVVEDNVVYRTTHGGFHMNWGRDNIVRNNIFALGQQMQVTLSAEAEQGHSLTFEGNIVYWTEGKLLHGPWDRSDFHLDRNLYFQAGSGAPALDFAGRTLEQWRALGQDTHSLIADPRFSDPAHGDFGLAPDSPALSVGFRPIDLSTVGPRRLRENDDDTAPH